MHYNFKNLVFEGGGVKGIAYGGALEALDKKGFLSNITRVAGTSAGAINATLLALDYSPAEVSKIIAETDFKNFEDKSSLPVNLYRLFKGYGWFKGDAFREWIGEKIKAKTGSARFTFRDLNNAINHDKANFRQLYVVATNLTQQYAEKFSFEISPSVPIRDSVRMSMSIPLYFRSVKKFGDVMIDGGVTYNYPINLFDNIKYLSNEKNIAGKTPDADGYVFNCETLGFRLDSKELIKYNRDDWKNVPIKINSFKDYALGLLDFMMDMANKAHLEAEDWNRTIFIDTLDVKTTDFKLKEEKIRTLIESGEKGVKDYFEWRDKDDVWNKLPV